MTDVVEVEPGPAFVLDASIALAWYFEDEADPYADAIAARFPDVQAVVPAIWPVAVANALLVGERRNRATQADTVRWVGLVGSLPIIVDESSSAAALLDTLNLARGQGLSAYDASYLELALRRGLPIAALDDRLRRAAAAVGVASFDPGP